MNSKAEVNAELQDIYSEKNTLELIGIMNEYRRRKEEIEEKLGKINEHYDFIRYVAIPQRFDDEGIKNMNVEGVGRVSLSSGLYASVSKERKQDAYQYLSDTGHGDIISTTINAQTLAATMKAMMQNGEEIPEELFTITPWTRASITKG